MSSAVPWYNDWFKISKFIPQHRSNSPVSPYTFVPHSLNRNFTNMQFVRDKSQKYIVLGQLKNPSANFEWSVPLKYLAILTKATSGGMVWYHMVNVDLYSATVTKVSNALARCGGWGSMPWCVG